MINKRFFVFIFFILYILFSKKIYAIEIQADIKYTKEYKEWMNSSDEERKNIPIPSTLAVNLDSSRMLSDAWLDSSCCLGDITLARSSKFFLNDYIDFKINNQGNTLECWAFSMLTSMESNLKYTKNVDIDFSERHMDYATSSSFIDCDEYDLKYTRKVSDGAIPQVGLTYLTNGQGAVLERKMPFKDDESDIEYNSINITPSYYVTDYITLPTIFKKYENNGKINYYDAFGNKYSEKDVLLTREKIKEYIVSKGAISAVTASLYKNGYNKTNDVFHSVAYCCKDEYQVKDHAVTIIGWDDNYGKENFNKKNRPNSDGAYLILQTYGDKRFDNGYMWISYEDSLIETSLFGISDSKKYDYKKIYQNDFYGANMTLSVKDSNIGYLCESYDRKINEKENLYQVAISLPQNSEIEIFVNPDGDELEKEKLIKVGSSNGILEAGYHTIDVSNVKLTGKRFAIVVKQKSDTGEFSFNIEHNINNMFYSKVDSIQKNSKISLDGKKWVELNNVFVSNCNLSKSDLCIKAFTTDRTFEKNKFFQNDNFYKINSKYIINKVPGKVFFK